MDHPLPHLYCTETTKKQREKERDPKLSDPNDVVADPPIEKMSSSVFSGDESAPFFGFLGAAAELKKKNNLEENEKIYLRMKIHFNYIKLWI